MGPGIKRTTVARLMAAFGCVCGILGFSMGPVDHLSESAVGFDWFASGTLLLIFAVFLLLDGAVAFQKAGVARRSLDD